MIKYEFTTIDGQVITSVFSGKDNHGSSCTWYYSDEKYISNEEFRKLDKGLKA